MPGKPAARVGDQTAHGGTIAPPGAPMVLIGGMPAARMNDMHICPMLNPGTPPPPHVGGQIIATCTSVLISGMPAARMGDTAICQGPPATIVGGCPTVLIGDGGGGGGGGAGGGASSDAQTSGTEEAENHKLDVTFKDKGGKPVSGVAYTVEAPDKSTMQGALTGSVKRSGLKEGDYNIELKAVTNAAWSVTEAAVGDTVSLKADISGFESGTKATIDIYEKDISSADDLVDSLEVEVKNDKVEADWVYQYREEDESGGDAQSDTQQSSQADSSAGSQSDSQRDTQADEGTATQADADQHESQTEAAPPPPPDTRHYSHPEYYFIVKVENASGRSNILEFKDYIEISLKDAEGNGVADAAYRVIFATGEVREGTLESDGSKRLEDIPPGRWEVEFPDADHVTKAID